jgi:DNA invertase Pin-like site-specific DNA recombinase
MLYISTIKTMRRTKKQIKQLILKAMMSSPKMIKTSEVAKATGLNFVTVKRYKEEIYKKIQNICENNVNGKEIKITYFIAD